MKDKMENKTIIVISIIVLLFLALILGIVIHNKNMELKHAKARFLLMCEIANSFILQTNLYKELEHSSLDTTDEFNCELAWTIKLNLE